MRADGCACGLPWHSKTCHDLHGGKRLDAVKEEARGGGLLMRTHYGGHTPQFTVGHAYNGPFLPHDFSQGCESCAKCECGEPRYRHTKVNWPEGYMGMDT